MAIKRQLKLKFGTMYGEKTWTINNADTEPTTQAVKTLMDTMITNGDIYKYPPLQKVSATLVTTNEADYDLS